MFLAHFFPLSERSGTISSQLRFFSFVLIAFVVLATFWLLADFSYFLQLSI